MAGYRYWLQGSLAVILSLIVVQLAGAQTDVPPVVFTGPISKIEALPIIAGSAYGHVQVQSASGAMCKVYSLADLDDPAMCKWIADTIPQMIEPGCWSGMDGKMKLSYYPPAKMLVIHQSQAVHARVDEFLRSVKQSLPAKTMAARTRHDAAVRPAQFAVPDNARPIQPMAPSQAGYPIPSPPIAPKHLFHFIIRYEGAGIIDSNVAKFAKIVSGQGATALMPNNDPMARMEHLMIDAENLRQQTPYRIRGGVGPASSSIGDQPATASMPPAAVPPPPPPPPPGNYTNHPPRYFPPSGPRTVPLMPMADPLPVPAGYTTPPLAPVSQLPPR